MTRRGVTLIEMLVTIVIAGIAFMALTVPFSAERSFWGVGKRQTEAQRDAQIALRAMARAARQSSNYTINAPGDITFTSSCGTRRFQGGPTFSNQLIFIDSCPPSKTVTLINGVRSRVTSFVPAAVVAKKLVNIQMIVSHRLRTTDPSTQTESLATALFLRNG